MKHIFVIIAAIVCMGNVISSCQTEESYAKKRNEELKAIKNFIAENHITVITKAQFEAQGCTTDTALNEYVLFNNYGVYMQIINKGTDGIPLPSGTGTTVASRFTEININTGDTTCTNMYLAQATMPDYFVVTNKYGTYTASFKSGMMYSWYESPTVPGGWLVPLKYVNLGRGANMWYVNEEGEKVPGSNAHVRIIVPHDQGNTIASSYVYAYFYDLTYELPQGEVLKQ